MEKEDVERFEKLGYQKLALVELLGHIKKDEAELWKEVRKKYKLDPKKTYTLKSKTRKIIEVI